MINNENKDEIKKLLHLIDGEFTSENFDGALDLLQEMKYRERVKIRVDDKMESVSKL